MCVCDRERERECVCVCEGERKKKERESVCDKEREREKERKRERDVCTQHSVCLWVENLVDTLWIVVVTTIIVCVFLHCVVVYVDKYLRHVNYGR